jgi:hypothetical protein
MSIRLTLYNDIQRQLEAKVLVLAPSGTLHHVDIWNSQANLANIEDHKQFKFPKVFIEFERSNYLPPKLQTPNAYGSGEQNYIENIVLHVFTHSLADETKSWKDKDVLMEQVKYAIKGMKGTNYGQLRLISDDFEKDHGSVFDSQLIFSTLVQEMAVIGTQIDATVGGTVTIDPNIDTTLIDITDNIV